MNKKWITTLLLASALLTLHANCYAESNSDQNRDSSANDDPSPIEALRYPVSEESKRIIEQHADRYREAEAAYKDYDPVKAHAIWYSLAVEGNMNAQFRLGQMRQKGQGVLADINKAVNWYRKAAIQGHADAMVALGKLFNRGKREIYSYPHSPSYTKLIKESGGKEPNWFAQAAAAFAEQNGIAAKTKRALAIFASIQNVDANSHYSTAKHPKTVSARTVAEKLVQEINKSDKTQFEKNATAEELYLLALLTHPLTHINPNTLDDYDDNELKQTTISRIKQSTRWMKKSANMGYLPAVNAYTAYVSTGAPRHLMAGAFRYEDDEEINTKLELSRTESYKWFVILKYLSEKQGRDYASAAYSNGMINMLHSACLLGKDDFSRRLNNFKTEVQSKDADEVIDWLEKHDINLTAVERHQIHCYFGNIEKANKILHDAANNNNPEAQLSLASAYKHGRHGYNKDPVKAQEIANKAITTYRHLHAQGDIEAGINLASQLYKGRFIEKDMDRAVDLYKSAAKAGHPKSYAMLFILSGHPIKTGKDAAKHYYWFTKALAHYPYIHLHNPLENLKKNPTATGPELTDAINRYEKELITLPQ